MQNTIHKTKAISTLKIRVQSNFLELYCEKLCGKIYSYVLVACEGTHYLSYHTYKWKLFFQRETVNSNNKKYFVKTIGYKLWYVIYGSTITTMATPISLANIGPRVKSHSQLSSFLILSSCQKKITNTKYYNDTIYYLFPLYLNLLKNEPTDLYIQQIKNKTMQNLKSKKQYDIM